MKLLARVVERLESLEMRFALIGAAAMAVHGASRSTIDIDLLTVDRQALESAAWEPVHEGGVEVEIRRGDVEDPLAGVVRFRASGERSVDLIVGRAGWQGEVLDRAEGGSYAAVELPVVTVADLVLLKLYARGPQDAWDIGQLLVGGETEELIAGVEQRVGRLDAVSGALWRRLVEESRRSERK